MTPTKRKKAVIGWTMNKWELNWFPKTFNQDVVQTPTIYPTKKDAEDWLRLPDGEYKAVKVKITIEEL